MSQRGGILKIILFIAVILNSCIANKFYRVNDLGVIKKQRMREMFRIDKINTNHIYFFENIKTIDTLNIIPFIKVILKNEVKKPNDFKVDYRLEILNDTMILYSYHNIRDGAQTIFFYKKTGMFYFQRNNGQFAPEFKLN